MNNEDFQKTVLKELKFIKEDLSSVKQEISFVKEDLRIVKNQTNENTQILQALNHSSEFNKATHEQMMTRMANMQGDITRIKTDVSILKKDLSTMEVVTANNYSDLAKLKAAQ